MNNKNQLVPVNDSLARLNNQIQVVNKILKPNEEQILIPYRKGEKWGFCDKNKKIIIPCTYDEVKPFKRNIAPVKSKGKWGIINKQGHMVIKLEFDDIGIDENFDFIITYKEKY